MTELNIFSAVECDKKDTFEAGIDQFNLEQTDRDGNNLLYLAAANHKKWLLNSSSEVSI